MLVRFTPKQLSKTKEFLKTVTLKAYDIELFQEIVKALDNAVDEKIEKPKQSITSTTDNMIVSKYVKKYEKPIQQEKIVEQIKHEEDITVVEQDENITNDEFTLEEDRGPSSDDLDNAPIFGTIDRRSKKLSQNYF